MASRDYRFRSVWSVEAPVPTVFGVLVDLGGYPDWWPDVRTVRQIDEDTAEVSCRATLPYTIVLRMVRVEENAEAGRLRVRLSGDLDGELHCELSRVPGGTRLDIGQVVGVRKPLLRALSPLARPVLRANHALMMRRGQRSLRAHLA
ncbi:Polyketide cyclase / dehydrase and lipid transport [Amycolatopsis marina]|uniref:Polyketide cyclase / dehydrase and lipid transport n=1 Tax=Amycolatopsis marina TaxID=490629 RepID=A0A1I1BRF7_9PSEU|nr:SRPBCC family protein [Amycolatopsis marina]SFB52412.1 Polyketide cyclase / dehydrase and lipid transport [Amycolatopsis marina]